MKQTAKKAAVLAFAMMLACMLLTACGQQESSNPSSSSSSSSSATEQTETPAASLDVSGLKTLGDVLAVSSNCQGMAYGEQSFGGVYQIDDSYVRVTAKMTPELYEQTNALDYNDKDYDKKFSELMSGLELEIVEDITADKIPQETLDTYVGKTGKDMVNDGFAFATYFMYGEDETGVAMTNGYYSYDVIFDAKVTEDDTNDEGASIMDATIKSVEQMGFSAAAYGE